MVFSKNIRAFVPDGSPLEAALGRTDILCVGAHQDDIEINAYGHLAAARAKGEYFTGVTVTDGAGSPRTGEFAAVTDEQMKEIRADEQEEAARLGGFCAMLQLGFSSGEVKKSGGGAVRLLAEIIDACSPREICTHCLSDKHDTHTAIALRVIESIRLLPKEKRPSKLTGFEGWRGLDWLPDDREKLLLDTSYDKELAAALINVFKSQCAGGKRYDIAALGRRAANATFYSSHNADEYSSVQYSMDMSALIDSGDPKGFILSHVRRMAFEIGDRIDRLI